LYKIENPMEETLVENEMLDVDTIVKKKEIRDYLLEVKMPALRKNLLKLYDDIEEKLKNNPASIKYHHNYSSGLYIHTLEVMKFALDIFEIYKEEFSEYFSKDDVILVSFIHDIEKTTKYKKNTLQQNGNNWTPFLYNYSKVDMNDTAEVVSIVSCYGIQLDPIHLNALTLHHGGYSVDKGKMLPLAVLLHSADLLSCNIGEIKR